MSLASVKRPRPKRRPQWPIIGPIHCKLGRKCLGLFSMPYRAWRITTSHFPAQHAMAGPKYRPLKPSFEVLWPFSDEEKSLESEKKSPLEETWTCKLVIHSQTCYHSATATAVNLVGKARYIFSCKCFPFPVCFPFPICFPFPVYQMV